MHGEDISAIVNGSDVCVDDAPCVPTKPHLRLSIDASNGAKTVARSCSSPSECEDAQVVEHDAPVLDPFVHTRFFVEATVSSGKVPFPEQLWRDQVPIVNRITTHHVRGCRSQQRLHRRVPSLTTAKRLAE